MGAAEIVNPDLTICLTKQIPSSYTRQPEDAHSSPNDQESYILLRGSHPVSDERSITATETIIEQLSRATANDLVICLISGGTSALLTKPRLPLADWQMLNQALLASGCTIHEFNTVRRQLDAVKGGGLAHFAAPATVISLILSDVVGNDLAVIGSGPTVAVQETAADALAILERYHITNAVETAVWQRIVATLEAQQGPQPTMPPVHHHIVGDVRQAALAATEKAEQLGFKAQLLTAYLEGEARTVGRLMAAIAKEMPPGHGFILGGETTVTIRGAGVGGRNQETALAAAIALDGWADTAVACFATDGDDGPTEAAGALITGDTMAYGRQVGLNGRAALDNNDSHTFFSQLDQKCRQAGHNAEHLLQTGPTGTNVNDLVFILRYPQSRVSG
jgi:glycerate 2-kinase